MVIKGCQRLAKVGYAGWKAAADPAGQPVTLPLGDAIPSIGLKLGNLGVL